MSAKLLDDAGAVEMLVRLAHRFARYWWTNWTAIEPSPTALAIRLTDRWRTSPTANTPGRLDSSRRGRRVSGHPAWLVEVGAGEDELPLVARDDALQPPGARLLADEDEDRRQVQLGLAIGGGEPDALQVLIAEE